MAWRVARSLDKLLTQINAAAPRRSKLSDGSIGDAAHASRASDHNPWVLDGGIGVVTARDYTHDPVNGLDCEELYQALVKSRDPRIKYVIWNRTITSGAWDTQPWVRRAYSGTNAHTKHLHLSVRSDKASYDDVRDWAFPEVAAAKPAPTSIPIPLEGADMELCIDPSGTIWKVTDLYVQSESNPYRAGALAKARGQVKYREITHEERIDNQADADARRAALLTDIAKAAGGDVDEATIIAGLAPKVSEALSTVLAGTSRPDGSLTRDDVLSAVREVFGSAAKP